jgi:hypothetical protein
MVIIPAIQFNSTILEIILRLKRVAVVLALKTWSQTMCGTKISLFLRGGTFALKNV